MNRYNLVVTANVFTDDLNNIRLRAIRSEIIAVLRRHCENNYLYRNIQVSIQNIPEISVEDFLGEIE